MSAVWGRVTLSITLGCLQLAMIGFSLWVIFFNNASTILLMVHTILIGFNGTCACYNFYRVRTRLGMSPIPILETLFTKKYFFMMTALVVAMPTSTLFLLWMETNRLNDEEYQNNVKLLPEGSIVCPKDYKLSDPYADLSHDPNCSTKHNGQLVRNSELPKPSFKV